MSIDRYRACCTAQEQMDLHQQFTRQIGNLQDVCKIKYLALGTYEVMERTHYNQPMDTLLRPCMLKNKACKWEAWVCLCVTNTDMGMSPQQVITAGPVHSFVTCRNGNKYCEQWHWQQGFCGNMAVNIPSWNKESHLSRSLYSFLLGPDSFVFGNTWGNSNESKFSSEWEYQVSWICGNMSMSK